MTDPRRHAVVACLLDRHGRTFASEAGIRLARNTPSPLFRLLCLSLLISARIGAGVAMAAARALVEAGWTTAPKMAGATWRHRTDVLNRAGYARYDESTSRYLGETAALVIDRYGGDLRRLRAEAGGDVVAARAAVEECKGIGRVGSSFFVREVQVVWDELAPYVDERARRGAEALGLPGSGSGLRALVDDAEAFARLVAALVRCELLGDHDLILAATE